MRDQDEDMPKTSCDENVGSGMTRFYIFLEFLEYIQKYPVSHFQWFHSIPLPISEDFSYIRCVDNTPSFTVHY